MAKLVADVLLLIFIELQEDPASLYSCILVNKTWCPIAIPILWRDLSYTQKNPITYNKKVSLKKLFNTLTYFLSPESLLLKNGVKLPSKRPLFNYMSYLNHISSTFINDMIQTLVEDEVKNYDYKRNLLEEEIYILILNNCDNIKSFNWVTRHSLYLFPKAEPFFRDLNSLGINLKFMNSTILYGLAHICRNITTLEVKCIEEDSPSLFHFINVQTNLQSLCLHFDNVREQCTLLSNAIEGKAATLKKFAIKSSITSISPKFLPSLKNLQYLILNNDGSQLNEHDAKWKEWKIYLGIFEFPNLKYLEISQLAHMMETFLIYKYTDSFRSVSFLINENKLIFENIG
jgi:hypothetical protein